MVGADFSFREHFKNLLNEPRTYIFPVLKGIGGTEKLLCTIVAPFFDKAARFDGFVLGALDLEKIFMIVRQAGLDRDVYAVVADDRGQTVYAPGWSAMDAPQKLDMGVVTRSNPVAGYIRLIRHESLLTNQPVVTTATVLASPPWYVWLSIPQFAEEALFRQWLVSSVALVLFVIVLVMLLSNATSGKLSSAPKALRTKAGLLQSHEYEKAHAVNLSRRAPTKVRALAQTFENMAHSIERARSELLASNALFDSRV